MKYLYIFIILFSSACSTLPEDVELYNVFEEYKLFSSKGSGYAEFFSNFITKKIKGSNKSQLLFSKYMSKERSHFSITRKNIGCLTINGFSAKNEAVTFYLEYKNEHSKWLISDIDVSFLESEKNFSSKALCPAEVRVK